jgi:hypothetical protein
MHVCVCVVLKVWNGVGGGGGERVSPRDSTHLCGAENRLLLSPPLFLPPHFPFLKTTFLLCAADVNQSAYIYSALSV